MIFQRNLENLTLTRIKIKLYLIVQVNEGDYRHYENSRHLFKVYTKCSITNIILEDNEKVSLKDYLYYLNMK